MDCRKAAYRPRSWGFADAAFICLGIVLAITAFQLHTGSRPSVPEFPFNWIAAGYVVLAAMSGGYLFRDSRAAKWVGGAKVATVNMILAAVIVLVSTLFVLPEAPSDFTREEFLGALACSSYLPDRLDVLLGDSPHSWPFAVCILMIIVNLSTAMGRRLRGCTLSSAGFFVLHGGILLAIVAAGAGSSQSERYAIRLHTGGKPESSFPVYPDRENGPGEVVTLPSAISLQDFVVETYPPTLVLVENDGTRDGEVHRSDAWIEKGLVEEIAGVRVEVLQYELSGDAPAARVRATKPDGTLDKEGLISCGSAVRFPVPLELGPDLFLVMANPRPKKFTAVVREEGGTGSLDHYIEMNRPASVGGWQIYLDSYKPGMDFTTVQFRLVRDPLLPVVYAGFGLIILGAFWMLWVPLRKDRRRETEK